MRERYVIDTNTLISAIFWPDSLPALALKKARKQAVILSQDIIDEWREVIARAKFDKFMRYDVRVTQLEEISIGSLLLPVSISVDACRDPKDNKFLELAQEAGATLIISGDKDLLDLNPFAGIPIVTARAFVERD